MKIRVGFVSNSSTSSFVGYGVYLSDDELDQAIEKVTGKVADLEDWDRHYNICEDNGLDTGSPYDDGKVIGLKFDKMKNNETKDDFFERTHKLLEKAFGTEAASGVCEQDYAWRDG